ncbi:MAG TPA: DegT/DnrJ/EryC1/StrS family aminotransferase [Candidatus Poseidoniales archaeon]|nr:MAG TPA: DegT/DnrJ/EryC1/StrS family aminotransferase [Candidatus Poseidoniales archaeon]|tara:strand:- start:329 stop:1420 length:1092 start_codon:yes stop_codon:yes gene_type:complete
MNRISMARPSWDDEMRQAAVATLDSLHWVKGPQGKAFGKEFSEYCNAVQGTPCQSGSVALWGALRLLEIGPGDEVLVPSLTYIATATCVSLVGATPVFVDVEPDHWCLDLDALEAARTPQTKAVIAVHLFGQMCDDALPTWCQQHGIAYIEDAAQAHGAVAGSGIKAGGIGDVACFSFFPSKNLAVGGEGGMMVTRREDLAARMDALVNHGRDQRLESHELGSNLRMSEVSAAIGRIQLKRLEGWLARRRTIADRYAEAFQGLPGVVVPEVRPATEHAWHQYCLLVDEPEHLRNILEEANIDSRVYYATPIHRQQVYAGHEQFNTTLPVTDAIAHRLVAVPVHHQMTDDEVQRVIDAVVASTR